MIPVLDRPRHPEKARRTESAVPRKPDWIRVSHVESADYGATRRILRDEALSTVCEDAACPNRSTCRSKRHATMMIMGATCTRGCSFCNVATGRPDAFEPGRVAQAVAKLGLRHVVITSVDRDDGGAGHFVRTIRAVRHRCPETTIEVLVPDFLHKGDAWTEVIDAAPDVFNLNVECVPRLYPSVGSGVRYYQSLRLLSDAKRRNPA